MGDLNSFVMNSAYNFYREGVLGNYYRKIGESTKQQADNMNQMARVGLLLGFSFLMYYSTSDSQSTEGAVQGQIKKMQLEIDKLKLELEVSRLKDEN